MSRLFQATTWSVSLPDGWTADPQDNYVQTCVPFAGAELRITPYHDETGQTSPSAWVRSAEHFDRTRGRTAIQCQCGDFSGYETRFDAGTIWIRGWALVADGYGLDVNYRCITAAAGRDDLVVDDFLSTLRRRRASPHRIT